MLSDNRYARTHARTHTHPLTGDTDSFIECVVSKQLVTSSQTITVWLIILHCFASALALLLDSCSLPTQYEYLFSIFFSRNCLLFACMSFNRILFMVVKFYLFITYHECEKFYEAFACMAINTCVYVKFSWTATTYLKTMNCR